MSRLHYHGKCLDWRRSACTASTDSKSKKTWWDWTTQTHYVHCQLGYIPFSGDLVALVGCLGRNDTSIMSHSLSKLASYKAKNLILDWIANLSLARTWNVGQEVHGSVTVSLALNIRAVSQYPTLHNADLRCARTSMICQQMLQLCYVLVCLYLICWQKNSISLRLTLLPNGIGKYAVMELSYQYVQDSPVHQNIDHRPPKAMALSQLIEPYLTFGHKYSLSQRRSHCQMRLVNMLRLICHNATRDMWWGLSGAPGLRSYASISCGIATNQRAGVSYSDTATQYLLDWLCCLMGLTNVQCSTWRNQSHDRCQGFRGVPESG